MLGKLVYGFLSYAPKKIYIGKELIENPSNELLISNGYKNIVETDMPEDVKNGFIYVSTWEENDDSIQQVWQLVAEPKKTTEQLAIELTKSKINELNLPDEKSLYFKELYPEWSELCRDSYLAKEKGFKFKYSTMEAVKLYKTVQDNFTFQSQWTPGEGTSAIFTQIVELSDENGELGTLDNPIDVPSDVTTNAFTYVVGKYYKWNDTVYLCKRQGDEDGKEYSFAFSPDQLIGQYFEVV